MVQISQSCQQPLAAFTLKASGRPWHHHPTMPLPQSSTTSQVLPRAVPVPRLKVCTRSGQALRVALLRKVRQVHGGSPFISMTLLTQHIQQNSSSALMAKVQSSVTSHHGFITQIIINLANQNVSLAPLILAKKSCCKAF